MRQRAFAGLRPIILFRGVIDMAMLRAFLIAFGLSLVYIVAELVVSDGLQAFM